MKEKLIHFIITHEKLWYLCRCVKGIQNKEFVNAVNHFDKDIMVIKTVEKGSKNKGKIIYDLHLNINSGFFAILDHILSYLYYADSLGLYPVVSLGDKFPYYESDGVEDISNPWEYYFQQYENMGSEDLAHSFRVALFQGKNFSPLYKAWGVSGDYLFSEQYITEKSRIMKKYIKLNDKTHNIICKDMYELVGDKKTLGVQIRMGGMLGNYDNHPIVPTLEEYVEEIKKALKTEEFEQIFLATDDERAVEKLKEVFGEMVVFYKDVARVRGMLSTYDLDMGRKNHNYLCGLEVLRDMYTLGNCHGLIAGISKVSTVARIYKKSLLEGYGYVHIINKGINHNKKRAGGKFERKTVLKEKNKLQKERMNK